MKFVNIGYDAYAQEHGIEDLPEPVEEVVQEQEQIPQSQDINIQNYKKLTKKVYERDYELGEQFEKNFIYKSFF